MADVKFELEMKGEERQSEKVVKVLVDQDEEGDILIEARDSDGVEWDVLTIFADGSASLAEDLIEELGFDLDDKGRLNFS